MLKKTEGLVLGYIKYGDSSIVTKIYTEAFGLQSYIVNGVRSSKSKNKVALFQSLSLVDLVVYHKESSDLKRISEIKLSYPFASIPFQQKKICMAIFLTEVLGKCLRIDFSDPELFQTIRQNIIQLDQMSAGFESLHLGILIELSGNLGFRPSGPEEIIRCGNHVFSDSELKLFSDLLEEGCQFQQPIPNESRRKFLETLLFFYDKHIDNFYPLNSLEILKEVLS
ncbi:MAG: recombination protein O N-terminal domain-containing protein [Cytophagaceae bacterium]|jgi:DNA repair protein RecO (recombination protein O)|nr:recombination protein O N-terminal domain-containing protein [Cytophagaceae bacterium]